MTEATPEYLTRPDGERLALKQVEGAGPVILWIGGFRSDMEGTKALALDAVARERHWAFVRYDHFAHGQSSGKWEQATVGRWCDDACALVDHLIGSTGKKVVPVGSSMGGWVALNLALARPAAIGGLALINPAQDFTERLMWPDLGRARQAEILETGETLMPDEGLGPYVLTREMFEEARSRMLPEGPLPIQCPVHILQGRQDASVPWRHQIPLMEALVGADVRLDLIAAGDHRLSTPADLGRMIAAVERLRAG
jgi:pimeloyl-ACP methyl ester carboxylesterase